MLRDSTVDVLDFDEFHKVLEMQMSTVGVDLTFHITRTVKNDVGKWMFGLPDKQTECSSASGLTLCRTITRTTNAFGEVEAESTSSSDGLDDTKLIVAYDKRDGFANVAKVLAEHAIGVEPFGVRREYDAHGFVVGVRDKATMDAYWELTDVHDAGRPSEEMFGNGAKTVRAYHGDKQTLKNVTTTRGAATMLQLSYAWDAQRNLKSRTDTLQAQHTTERFRYDALERLTTYPPKRLGVAMGPIEPRSYFGQAYQRQAVPRLQETRTSISPWRPQCMDEPLARRIDPAQTASVTRSTKLCLHGVPTPHLEQHPRLTRNLHSPFGSTRSRDVETPSQVWIGTFA